jgi:double zinc ribbon protein
VRCPKCGSDNPSGKKFCGDCGAPFATRCPKCGTENPPGKRFCGDCSFQRMAAPPQRSLKVQRHTFAIGITEQPDSFVAAEGERKTVTALFADIQGSTELIRDLDP